ncbi:MAG: LLM class flavin-dependent oxidoreductase [Chloroflexi bacterium]|nr:LLM class flavin-dependent oxidoreductase [Chloroflexota bacterium]
MKFGIFTNPATPGVIPDGVRLAPIGRNNDRYQQLLEELKRICFAAEDMGFDSFSTTEHHFHSEGIEMSVAPLLLYTDLAARTKRIKFAPLAIVLTTRDPIRVAEELAVLDHLTKGRLMAGFARGYQDRWVSVLGQKYKVKGTQSDKSATNERNRRLFEENWHIIKAAWTQDVLSYKGEFYEVPFPYEEGIRDWVLGDITRERGAPGEIDDEGVIRGVSVVPKPYQQPYPPVFMAFSLSETSIRFAAREGMISQIQVSNPEGFKRLCHVYQEVAAENGRELKLGEQVAAPRYVYIGKTYEEALQRAERTLGWQYDGYFGAFGFMEGFRNPEDPEEPKPLRFKNAHEVTKRLIEHQFALVGTVDDIKRQMESLARCHDNGELEWFTFQLDQGYMPIEEAMDQLEIFGTKIMPEFQG